MGGAEKLPEIDKIRDTVELRPVINNLNVQEIEDVYSKTSNTPYIKTELDYRVVKGKLPNTEDKFTLADDRASIDRGKQEVTVEALTSSEIRQQYIQSDKWVDKSEGTLGKIVPPVDIKEFLQAIEDHDLTWPEYVHMLADDTGHKDERLIKVALATKVPMPNDENKGLWQSINNHALKVTQTGTGKSTTYERLMGQAPSSDWSEPGLLGSIDANTHTQISGKLQGKGVHAIDEFPEDEQGSIMKRLLNYMERGETRRTLQTEVVCEGTKAVAFLGNPPLKETSEEDFKRVLRKLAGDGDKGRVGRRLAHILYGMDFDTIDGGGEDYKRIQFMRLTVDELIAQNYGKIKTILKMATDWIYKDDPQYENDIEKYLGYVDNELREFMKGHSRATARLKTAGLKLTIIYNLPRIHTTEDIGELYGSKLHPQAKRHYRFFKDANLESFSFFLESDKEMAFEAFRKFQKPEEIEDMFTVDKEDLEEWFDEWKKELLNPDSGELSKLYRSGLSTDNVAKFTGLDKDDLNDVLQGNTPGESNGKGSEEDVDDGQSSLNQ